ncbi:MAG TPA: NAD-dependent epimerase/dehydratase family protein [Candidatus Binatia bacterium]|nr:NAD-dependent epimerase/dehydratase family protein [Candidatus Binatia bacterium]
MKVLITGGTGFLGSHLVEACLERGDEVLVMDTAGTAKIEHLMRNPRLAYHNASLLNPDVIDRFMRGVELVYHLGAVVGVEHYVTDPFKVLNVNVNGTQHVLAAAMHYGSRVVFGSTSEVYGRNPKIPYKEYDDRVLGSTSIDRWCYSTSKAVGEHFCFAYHKKGLPVTIVRYFNIYGPRLDAIDLGRVVTIFMGQVLRGEDVTVVGDGSQTRCFTYVSDAIRATVQAGLKGEAIGGIFNIGTDEEISILDFAKAMIEVARSPSRIRFVTQQSVYGNSYEDIQRRVPDNTRMKEILGVVPEISVREGLRRTIEWFREAYPQQR